MLSKFKLSQLYFKDTSFVSLMTKRIFNVLLVANPYDAFMLEDDGRIDEKIFNEYMDLSLRYPPRFTQVSTEDEAWKQLDNIPFDLVICMPGTDNCDSFQIARNIKKKYEHIPLVVLTPFSHGITQRIEHEDLSMFEYVFCWLGNTDLLLSIIKLIEDKMNLEHDVEEVGVQVIMLVEDSIRFYSSVLPYLFRFVLKQSQEFSTEALNPHQQTLRMRGRPKIVLVRSYEEAWTLYEKYANNMLGIITDVRFPRNGVTDPLAGIKLCRDVRNRDEFIPIIIQSSETENQVYAHRFNASFIDKNSKKMDIDLRQAVSDNFGFGDFVFRNPDTREEIARVRNLKELQNIIFAVPKESFLYHIRRNHISRWLYSRAIFPVAEFLKQISWDSLQDVDAHRRIIFDSIVRYRKVKNQGVVAIFKRDRFDRYSNFARIGEGSLGGKGRGLAFIDNMIKHHPEFDQFENAEVAIPKTVVLCTDVFDEFMDMNGLYQIALSDAPDDVILKYFLKAKLPDRLVEDFFALFDVVKSPIAIRSSSLLEDSHYQPFAGIYSTYMIPYLDDKYEMLRMLSDAIKGVYASVYYRDSKAYMQATSNLIDQEKMAVILQEVVGNQYGDRFYPSMSGVARSLNYYPIGDEKPEEGTVSLALGLGKYIVDGGLTLRFSPYHPHQILQTSEMEIALRETQTRFYALDMKNAGDNFSIDDGFNLLKLPVKEAENDGSLRYIASTYDPYDQVIRDGYSPARCLPPCPRAAISVGQRAGIHDAPGGDRICRHARPRERPQRHVLPVADTPYRGQQGDARRGPLTGERRGCAAAFLQLVGAWRDGRHLRRGVCQDGRLQRFPQQPDRIRDRRTEPQLFGERQALCIGGTRTLGEQRHLVRNPGEVAAHFGGPRHCGGRAYQLSGGSQPRNALLPELDFVRRRLFHHQRLLQRRGVQPRLPEQLPGGPRDTIPAPRAFQPSFGGEDGREEEDGRGDAAEGFRCAARLMDVFFVILQGNEKRIF